MNMLELKNLLKEKGGNVKNAAKTMDIKQPTIQDILTKGIENTSVKNLIKIANYLNLKTDDIINQNYKDNKKRIIINDIENTLTTLDNDELVIMKNILDNIINLKNIHD